MEVGFSFIPDNIKYEVKKLEKITISIEKEKSKVMFNEQCLINEILPNYTNIRLHDSAVLNSEFTFEFRKNLIKEELRKSKSKLDNLYEETSVIWNEIKNNSDQVLR